MSDDEKRYNGWTNYETWNVALWINNEQHTYNHWRSEARVAYRYAQATKHLSRAEVATRAIAKQLQEEVEASNPLGDQAGMYQDILGAALSEVNYDEIAGNWVEEAQEEIDAEEAEEATAD